MEVADNGLEALEVLDGKDFDIILMDVQMPHMDGWETTAEIRRREKKSGRHTPIIGLSARVTPEDIKMSREAGMNDYLTKPIKPATLSALLDVINKPTEQ